MNPAMMQAPGVEGMAPVSDAPAMDYSAMPATDMSVAPTMQPMQPMENPTVMPEVGGQPGVLPMPSDGLTPPPVPPMPDFGQMPQMPSVDQSVVQPGAYQIPTVGV